MLKYTTHKNKSVIQNAWSVSREREVNIQVDI